jgi:hypothetical protein
MALPEKYLPIRGSDRILVICPDLGKATSVKPNIFCFTMSDIDDEFTIETKIRSMREKSVLRTRLRLRLSEIKEFKERIILLTIPSQQLL